MAKPHPIDGLFALLDDLRYPPGVSPTDALVEGPEFFPGGCGLMGCGPRQVGAFPGARDPRFVADCAAILRATLHALRPRAVLVLGRRTWRHLEVAAPAFAAWRGVRSFADLDRRDLAVLDVTLEGVPSFGAVTVVPPSGADMGGNRKKRRFRGPSGLEADAASLRHALHLGSHNASP